MNNERAHQGIQKTPARHGLQKEGAWGRLKMDEKQLGFAVFLIHALAREWRRPCGWVYQTLNGSGLLDDYILAFYDVLHTQGREYLVEDITGFARDKGISV